MKIVATIFAILLILLLLDLVWLKFVMADIFRSALGDTMVESPRMLPAVLFYVMYAVGTFFLVVEPSASSTWTRTISMAALFGLMAYGTYDLTNMATLKPWTWKLVGIDMAWGTFATTLSAIAGRRVMEWMQ
jgi:uncharacterized membrane protein